MYPNVEAKSEGFQERAAATHAARLWDLNTCPHNLLLLHTGYHHTITYLTTTVLSSM
jgi:hypothetical protein